MSLRPRPEWLATCEVGDAAVILLEDIQESSPGRALSGRGRMATEKVGVRPALEPTDCPT